jgi:hypothetical protein
MNIQSKYERPAAHKPKRRSLRARQADQDGWRQLLSRLPRLPTIEEAPYAASNVLMGKDRQYLDTLFPTVPTGISADINLQAHVQARWPTVTSNEHKMIETMMRAHPNISDRNLRVYLGLRRGSVPKEEW